MDLQPAWSWSSAAEPQSAQDMVVNRRTEPTGRQQEAAPGSHQAGPRQAGPRQAEARNRSCGPRTCRICLDTEQPKYPTGLTSTFGISSASSRPSYISDDPELGRLLSPCRCKGSQKYVHEGCLNSWRLAEPMAARNYWQCPTCMFNYRLARLQWASMLSSKWTQMALTLSVVVVGIFTLGFVADPILDLWLDPVGTISDTVTGVVSDAGTRQPLMQGEATTWAEHFAKGFFSLGLVGFVKSVVAMGPWHWLNLRSSGLMGSGRRRGTGRARMDNFNLLFVMIGAFTFMMAIWKVVKALSARVLQNVSNKVLDVGAEDDDGEAGEEEATVEGEKHQ